MSKQKAKLSVQEQRDRIRLEQTVFGSIQSAQRELAEIERTGIWCSSHKTFEEYCKQRFGFDPFNLDAESLIQLADCSDRASPNVAPESKLQEDKL